MTTNIIKHCYYGIKEGEGVAEGNFISRNEYGIDGYAGTATDNTIWLNGIGVSLSDGDIRNNEIYSNEGGILDCDVSVSGNTLYNNYIAISHCDGAVSGNTVESSELTGINSCNGNVVSNYVRGNTYSGIELCNGTVEKNTVIENGYGIFGCNGTVQNNIVAANFADGVASCDNIVANNTIINNKDCGVRYCIGTVKNNIIAYNESTGLYGSASNSYNCFFQNAGGSFYDNYAKTGDMYDDPKFYQSGSWDDNGTPGDESDDVWSEGDCHLLSEYGRWDPVSKDWVADSETSPCVNAGDPADSIEQELNPNGGRINMGAYGGTLEASKSLIDGPEPTPECVAPPSMDTNDDCKVDLMDLAVFASEWLSCGLDIQSECWEE